MRERRNQRHNQTLYLFLGFLILFILSFTLGVIVGKGLSGSEETQTVREETPQQPQPEEVPDREKASDTIIKEEVTAAHTSPSLEQKELEATKTTEEPIAEQTAVPSTRTEEIVEQTPANPEPEEEKAESKTAEIEEQPSATPTSSEEQVKVESDKEQPRQNNIKALPKVEAEGKYTVQIGSFEDEAKAKQIVESLSSKGYPVFMKRVDISGQGTRYRARVGTFKSREDARLYGDNLKNREPDIVKLVFVTINN